MKVVFIKIIKIYQRVLSPDKGIFAKKHQTCVFYPTCSDYSIEAVTKYGVIKGFFMSIRRVLRCHPWQKDHIDPLK